MKQYKTLKKKAIQMRLGGNTYNEILNEVPVSKSTLSLWLRSVRLAKAQKHTLTLKKKKAQKQASEKRRRTRIVDSKNIYSQCQKDIQELTNRELFLAGIFLYWAEGTKQNEQRVSAMVDFANSDPAMVALFVKWLQRCCKVILSDIQLRLHLHESHKDREIEIQKIWSSTVGLPTTCFSKTLYKKHNVQTVRYKIGDDYIGLVSVRVKKSTHLNRRIMGWIYAIIATQN